MGFPVGPAFRGTFSLVFLGQCLVTDFVVVIGYFAALWGLFIAWIFRGWHVVSFKLCKGLRRKVLMPIAVRVFAVRRCGCEDRSPQCLTGL